jgi:hypothetical protein
MFKVGDEVVCIGNIQSDWMHRYSATFLLTLGKKYYINSVWKDGNVTVINDVNSIGSYPPETFILFSELRRNKLKKICSKLEI